AAYGDLLALAVRYQARCAFLLFMSCQLILSSASVSRGVHLKQEPPSTGTFMTKSKYAIFDALNPFFEIVQEGLTGLVWAVKPRSGLACRRTQPRGHALWHKGDMGFRDRFGSPRRVLLRVPLRAPGWGSQDFPAAEKTVARPR